MAIANWIWRETAEVLGALGVIASMIFVGLEVRQNTNTVRGATIQAISQQSLDLAILGVEISEVRLAFAASNSGTLSPEQAILMNWFIAAKLRADENRYRQIELGILDASNLQQLSAHGAYRTPYFADYWARNSGTFASDFQEVVDREFLPLSQPVIAEND